MSTSSCTNVSSNIAGILLEKPLIRKLQVAKVIYNYKGKTEKQIKDAVQLGIDNVLVTNPAYKFVDSKSHFNKTGGIDLQLNFELK